MLSMLGFRGGNPKKHRLPSSIQVSPSSSAATLPSPPSAAPRHHDWAVKTQHQGLGKERKGKERKGKERKGKERKGKERKGKERKGKGRRKWL